MTEDQIQELRDKYPISYEEICLYSSFEQVLGKTNNYTPEERYRRWKKAMSFSAKMNKYWSDTTDCDGCAYLDKKATWCLFSELPCTVNPILTFRYGMIGMACMGLGRAELEPELFQNTDF